MEYNLDNIIEITNMKYHLYIMLFKEPEDKINKIKEFLKKYTSSLFQNDILLVGTDNDDDFLDIKKFLKKEIDKNFNSYVKPFKLFIDEELF